MTLKNPYWTAGTLEGKAYIERDADLRLRKELLENQRYIFLFGPRHGGTSSLVTHCMDSLSPGQYCCTRIDLSKLPHTDYQTLIGALLETIANDTALDKQEILTDFPEDTILAWLSTFPQRLILFLDEVQALGELPFRDQVFGKLRFLYNVRVENEQYTRLQVVLSGSVHPERLIPANLATPFVGGSIAVLPLTSKQVEKLTWDLESAQVQIDPQVSSLLYQQTGGVVHLCQSILHALWENAEKTRLNVTVADVERVIDHMVAAANKEPHFTAIYQAMIADPARLAVFLRFVKGDSIEPGVLQDLTLTGLCDPERPYLCTIYERVFGPGGPLDLGLALRHSQVTGQMEAPPSQNTPEVNILPPPESRREYSLLTKLPTAPYSIIETQTLLPEPPQPQPLPLPGVVVMEASSEESAPYLPPMPMGPSMGTPSVNTPTANRPVEQAAAARASVEATATGIDSAELPAPEFSSPELVALSEPPPPPSGSSGSGEVVEIEAPEIEEPTWVDKNPVKKMSDQVAAAKAAADRPQPSTTSGSVDPKVEQTRLKLADKLMLSAELDSFCASFFPHVAQKFAPGMSRAEKTDLLLGLVAASEINKRLREWSSRIELHQEVVSSVTSRGSAASAGAASAGSETVQSAKSTRSGKEPAQPPAPPSPPPIEDSASFKAPGPMQVGVGLVLANRYFLTTEVGRGSVAVVWSAYDRIKDEQVALKLIFGPAAEKPTVLEVFWRSAQQMAALSHPAIVGVLNKPREENEVHYVVMEFLPGGNLRQWVQGGKLNRGQILRVLQRLGAGLQYAHERRVMHRNIKPTNILFDGTGHARLTDFSIVWPAEVAGSTETRSDRLIFMAPEEQIGGGGDPRSDVYSLGMCALYAFYGQELPSRVVQDRSSFIEALDATPAIKAVLRRATAASPAERFASAAEFCRALEFDSPALPGISVRNSLSSIPAIKAERSGPESPAPLSSNSMRQAPQLANNPPMYAPGIPNTPSGTSAPALPESQLVAPPSPMPIVIPGLHAPDLLIPQSDPRSSKRDPDSGEIPPMPGRNPQNLAQYAIDTDRTRAVGTPMPLGGPPQVMVPLPPERPRRWQPLAFAGIALLALGGAGLGYWWGTQRANPVVIDTGGPVVVADNRGVKEPEYTRPLRVEPLVQPQPEPPPAAPVPTPPPAEKTMVAAGNPAGKKAVAPTVVAMNAPTAAKPGQKVATPPVAPTVGPNTTQAKPTAVAMNPTAAKPGQKPVPPPVAAPPTAAKPTAVAMNPQTAAKPGQKPGVAPVVGPNTTQAKPTAVATAPQPAAKPAAVPAKPVPPPTKLAMVQPSKGADTVAKAPQAVQKAAETPVQRPKVAATPPKAKTAPPRPVAAPPPPRPVTPAVQQSSAEADATLQSAQGAFVRGQHQQAIAMAMQVTTRGGPDAIKAWRFVGGAACSVRSAQLATNAYNHLRDPSHRQLLVDLCRRNGLQFNGSAFMVEE